MANERMKNEEMRGFKNTRHMLKYFIKKVITVRMRYLAGDPDLKPRPLDSHHSRRQFDRIYIEDPIWWMKHTNDKYASWDFVKKRYLGQ